MIDYKLAWNYFFKNSKDYLLNKRSFYSPKQGNEYQIIDTGKNRVKLKRLSVPSQTTETITYNNFINYIKIINNNNGSANKEMFKNPVAIRVAIVELTPMLDWNETIENIEENTNYAIDLGEVLPNIREAFNDDSHESILRYLRLRRGQNKLRENLFIVYNESCCITKSNIKEILHACHLYEHSASGNNHSTNSLLLRADIHDLFDSFLIGINPDTLSVKLSKRLLNTEYQLLEGKILSRRKDGLSPNKNSLNYRWEQFIKSENKKII